MNVSYRGAMAIVQRAATQNGYPLNGDGSLGGYPKMYPRLQAEPKAFASMAQRLEWRAADQEAVMRCIMLK